MQVQVGIMESTVINQPQQQQPSQESPNPMATGSNNTTPQPHVGGEQQSAASGPGHSQQDHRSGQNPYFVSIKRG